MLLLLLLLCHHTSQQEQTLPAGRCDVSQTQTRLTPCTSRAACASNTCPHGFRSVGTFNCSYIFAREEVFLRLGCQHQCVRSFMEPRCCPSFWGPLCLPCPSWSGRTCNLHGTCMDGDAGNGTCVCDEGFTGFACQECKDPTFYGEKCNRECNCQNGVCNNGPDGDGQCFCQPPHSGARCDRVNSRCSSCSPYSYCKGEGDSAYCECLPGYRTTQGRCERVCSERDCDVNAECTPQRSEVSCTCKPGYEGNGRICEPKNPCTKNNGGCPSNSSYCVFEGPNKSSCTCMFGMSPVRGSAELGCELVPACSADTCHPSAQCITAVDGQAKCICRMSQISDGWRCFGNLMERLIELDSSGTYKGQLTGAVALFEKGCSSLLSIVSGSLTVFLPLLKTPLTDVDEAVVCKNHLILSDHLYGDLEGQDYDMYGGAVMRTKGNNRFILMDDPSRQYSVLQADLPASNGVIHIVDQPILKTLSERTPRDQQYADKTIGEILTMDEKFNRFLSLVDNCGDPPPLRGPGPLTVFVPTNEAVDRARDGSILYMLNDAKPKLQELLRHHVYSQAALSVDDLVALNSIHTMANQVITILLANTGRILLGKKFVHLASTNIVASNGIIHMIDGLLYPPSILPIMPHRCDILDSRIITGPCVHCLYLDDSKCPDGTVEMDSHQSGCSYTVNSPSPTTYTGCAKYCNASRQIEECCKGFYGPDCKPCIGGFQHPCYDKGVCSDGIRGNGSCSCQPGFKGIACHICEDPTKHGYHCDEECHCVHGDCDNRPGSGGVCRRGSCREGFSGELCDKTATPCNSDGLHQHCHIDAYCTLHGLHAQCVCKDGYEGDGHSCSQVNPCLTSNHGGCDPNAACVFAGPGNASCVCAEGWTGDGQVCVEINECELDTRGGCSPNADCFYIGPGQHKCACKTGFIGNGHACERINPCTMNYGGCDRMATCDFNDTTHTCTCPDGYGGNGTVCFSSLSDEMEMNPKYMFFRQLILQSQHVSLNLSGGLTMLTPATSYLGSIRFDDIKFWRSRHRLLYFLRAHFLLNIYSVEDLSKQIGKKLPTLNPNLFWEVSNSSKGIHIGNATIVTYDLPATDGIIHIIDQLLIPSLSDLHTEPPSLMAFLNSSSNFTLFRQYAQMYNLTSNSGLKSDYTILAPTDDAIKQHLSQTNKTLLDMNEFNYHVIFGKLLLPDQMYDGLFIPTSLGSEYEIQVSIDDNNQTFANSVPLNGTVVETQYGLVLVLPQVLKIQRNRCNSYINVQTNGRCTDCEGAPRCLFSNKPTKEQFPANMKANCRYRKRVGSRRKSVPGCVIKCLRQVVAHTCCPGFYGYECFKCPGDIGSWCSNHGECQDGVDGNGECRCYEGFHGTACEDCEPGRYGVNCTQKCACAHGKCEDGLAGSGKCVCYKGWKGAVCSQEIKDDACGGNCDENANCLSGPNGSAATCVCVAGYQGNGTYCKELDLCHWSNGGCSENAVCTKVSAGERTCTCREGYTGDGVVCLEMNVCLVNNGGCHKMAECIRSGHNTIRCRCLQGYQGSGLSCEPGNLCLLNNGGCSKYARCSNLGNGQRNCTCRFGYIGDGLECRGTTYQEMQRQPENRYFSKMFLLAKTELLWGEGPFTVFIPSAETNDESAFEAWNRVGRLADLVRYHIVSCETLTLSDLKTTNLAVSTSGLTLHFSVNQHSVWINNSSRIVRSDYTTSNGVIHHVDRLLTPYALPSVASRQVDTMNFTEATQFYGYTRFYKMVEAAGLLPVLKMRIHKPFTMFWPTDKALNSLPASRQQWLFSPDHQEELAFIVKAHILRVVKLNKVSQPGKYTKYRSMHGSEINFSCDRNKVGAILINDNEARLVERYMFFRDGLAFGIDQLLEPPGLGAHCDTLENTTTYGQCGLCSRPPSCRFDKDTGKTKICSRSRRLYNTRTFGASSWYTKLESPSRLGGCRRICASLVWRSKCCKNHYGRDCQVCPGGLEAPCNHHGNCSDGLDGSGTCVCNRGFRGTACEQCMKGFYGPNCLPCECGKNGLCDAGIDGSGECTCAAGWMGKRCETDRGSIPLECQQCHHQADCLPAIGCLCKAGYQGNGTFCTLEPFPDLCSNYNGGCHHHADCNQTGLIVNCTCHTNYKGDGFSCEPVNRCTEEANGGCSDFASCKFTGPNERECNCMQGFVGNGIQCLEKLVPPVDRCLEENGGCHYMATCHDLHYYANTAGVFHLRSPAGKYKMNFSEAATACQAEGAALASFKQLGDAQQLGMHLCVAGWMEGGKVGYPTRYPSLKCGDNHVGLVMYREPVDQSSKYDAYCYRLKDVSCKCPADYVGNGDFCNGLLTSVLATNSNFSTFYKLLLDYSDSSSQGKRLMDILSHKTSELMLFVPHNSGFTLNKTLSERDIEYHFSANHSIRPFKDLHNQEVIVSRLGFNLTVSHGDSESSKMVNKRLLLDWDIPAVNGIIHVIEAPLAAPPMLVPPHHASRGHAHSSGAVSAILVTLLLACVLAALGYYVFKHKTDAFRFHYFKNEDEDNPTGGRTKPTLVSIPNPLYSGSPAFAEPFGENSQEMEQTKAEEPSKILDLDE